MKNHQLASAYLTQASEILLETESVCQRGVWNLAVRRAQEVVELSLKATLRLAGVEIPRIHDVGIVLKDHRRKFPPDFEREIEHMASISRRLRREREMSFDGDEETGASPQELYSEEDARSAVEDARHVLETCRKLLAGDA